VVGRVLWWHNDFIEKGRCMIPMPSGTEDEADEGGCWTDAGVSDVCASPASLIGKASDPQTLRIAYCRLICFPFFWVVTPYCMHKVDFRGSRED